MRRPDRQVPRRGRLVLAVVTALALSVLAATTPGSMAALTAVISNSTDSAQTAAYFTCAGAYSAASPLTYYKLDDATTTTTAIDSGSNARNGVYRGTVTRGVSDSCNGDPGSAATFDGTTGYISNGGLTTSGTAYTTEAWVKTTTAKGGLITAFSASATGASLTVDRVLYLTNTGRLVFGVNNATKVTITSPAAVNDGAWHHVMATAGAAGLRLYVDGVAVASSASTITATYAGYFRVGYDTLAGWPSVPTSNFFTGTLDEVAQYGQALTSTDASNHYIAARR